MSVKDLYPSSDPLLGAEFSVTKNVPPGLQFARASTGTYVGPDGLIRTATVGEPRFDHDPITGENKGLLVEPTRTNLITNSSPITGGSFTGLTRTPNSAIAPDGTFTASLFTEDTGINGHNINLSIVIQNRVFSVYVKPAGRTLFKIWGAVTNPIASFLLTGTGSVFNSSDVAFANITNYPNGWYRCVLSTTGYSTIVFGPIVEDVINGTTSTYQGDGVSGIYIWGAQLEQGLFPTAYIPTTTSTVTRTADSLSPIILPTSNSSTILVETESLANNTPVLSLNDSTSANEITLINYLMAGGSSLKDSSGAIITSIGGGRPYKSTSVITVNGDQAKVVSDGTTIEATTTSVIGLNRIRVGSNVASTSAFAGTVKKLYVYDSALPDEEARALSTRKETSPFPPATEPNLTLGVAIEAPNTTWNLRSTGTVDYDVDWGDGQVETAQTSNTKAHTYVSPGIYKVVVKINSGVWTPYYNDTMDAEKIAYIISTGENWSFGTNLTRAFSKAVNLIIMKNIYIDNVTNLLNAWRYCSSLISFPLINTVSVTDFGGAWSGCRSLLSFPLIDTSIGTNFNSTWRDCDGLTSFPAINTSLGTNFLNAWNGCSGLTNFPLIDTSKGTNFTSTWQNCSKLTSFPAINTSSGTNFLNAWNGCSGLTNFPLIDTSSATGFQTTWYGCSGLTNFPLIDTSKGTNFFAAWAFCSSLTSFPALDTSSAVSLSRAWWGCSSLTSFPLLNVNKVTAFGDQYQGAWLNCSSLTDFPAGFFDNWGSDPSWPGPTDNCFAQAWEGCVSLTAASVENILNSLDTSGKSAPSSGVSIRIRYNTSSGTPNIATAISNLKSRGWVIILNGVAQ